MLEFLAGIVFCSVFGWFFLWRINRRQMDMIEKLHKHLAEQNEALFYLNQKDR